MKLARENQTGQAELNALMESAPALVKGAVLFWVTKIRNADSQIRQEQDIGKKINLLSQQIKWSAYMTGLVMALDSGDKSLQSRIKGMR